MNTIIKYMKLPLHFNAFKMLEEVRSLADVWLLHYNRHDYTGDWKAIPLRSINGTTSQAYAHPGDNAEFIDTVFLHQCAEINTTLDKIQCKKKSVRLLNLRPGAIVKEHKDPGLCFEEGEVRLHIPLLTNDKVEFYIEDEAVKPLPGECWYMNFNLKHKLANNGDTDRIHLVIDCIVNDWVKQLFALCDEVNIKRIPIAEQFSSKEKLLMISQLKMIGSQTALIMASKLEEELNTSSL